MWRWFWASLEPMLLLVSKNVLDLVKDFHLLLLFKEGWTANKYDARLIFRLVKKV